MDWKNGRNLDVLGNAMDDGRGERKVGDAPRQDNGVVVVHWGAHLEAVGVLQDVGVHGKVHVEGALHVEEVHGEVHVGVTLHYQTVPLHICYNS